MITKLPLPKGYWYRKLERVMRENGTWPVDRPSVNNRTDNLLDNANVVVPRPHSLISEHQEPTRKPTESRYRPT